MASEEIPGNTQKPTGKQRRINQPGDLSRRSGGQPSEVNYLYFCFFFLFIFALTFSHFVHASQPLWGVPLFFLFYAGTQALLEVFFLIFIGLLLHRRMPRWTFRVYVALSFVFLLAHFANFTLVRIMDVSLSYCFKVFLGRGFEHFLITCQATNVNPMMTAIIIGAFIVVPVAGLFFYGATHKLSSKIPLKLSYSTCVGVIALLSLILFSLDLLAKPYMTSDLHDKYSKKLPLCATFLSPAPKVVPLEAPLQSPRNEEEVQALLEAESWKASHLPNIYLFVIETLRSDIIDKKTAPHLTRFGERNISPSLAYSSANFTYLSWFSLFHSGYPYFWISVRDSWKGGSVPLRLMKKLGYKIKVYSSADLNYFGMDRIIFGQDRQLVDDFHEYFPLRVDPWERDSFAMKDLIAEMKEGETGNLYLVFLDSTHSEYSSPEWMEKPFYPAAVSLDYLGITRSEKDLELLKNRYRNSVFWVDSLMGSFFDSLKQKSLSEKSLIVVTGDHGEEFFEEGSLFHGTHLNDWQTKVPIFYQLPGLERAEFSSLSTHLDIFPSLIHYLTGYSSFPQLYDGESIFAPKKRKYAFTMQHNGVDIPYEFRLLKENVELVGRFFNPPNIFSVPAIEVLSFKTNEEEGLRENFLEAFEPLIKPSPSIGRGSERF